MMIFRMTVACMLTLLLTGCGVSTARQQLIDDYAATVPAALLDLQERLSAAGTGPWKRDELGGLFRMHKCPVMGKQGYNILTATVIAKHIDAQTIASIGNEVLVPLGFAPARMGQEYDGTFVHWIDPHHGGFVTADNAHGRTDMMAQSGCLQARDPEAVRALLPTFTPAPGT